MFKQIVDFTPVVLGIIIIIIIIIYIETYIILEMHQNHANSMSVFLSEFQ